MEIESHKRKAGDEPRFINKNKPMNERISKGAIQDRPVRERWEQGKAFTPLNAPHAKLLMEIRDMKELKWPKPMMMPSSKKNQGKYYHFHKDHGIILRSACS